jgi:hypothetical protein
MNLVLFFQLYFNLNHYRFLIKINFGKDREKQTKKGD